MAQLGGLQLPTTARLHLIKTDAILKPLEFVDMVNVPGGKSGMFFAVAMQVESTLNFNFMEGCFHFYDKTRTTFPGMIMSTGMEDYFDSAFYFNGGDFHAPVAGSSHQTNVNGTSQWSGYRFHEMDPIVFSDGMRFQWRNGDVTDTATGLKCTLNTGGQTCGNPQSSHLVSYSWVYLW